MKMGVTGCKVVNDCVRKQVESHTPSGMDWILRTLCPLGAVPGVPVCQPEATGLGDAQVQALQTPYNPSQAFLQKLAKERVDLFVH